MSTLILINTTQITFQSANTKVWAGETVTNAAIQAELIAGGGILAPATDPNLVAAQAVVAQKRHAGANEAACDQVMMAAYTTTPYLSQPVHVSIAVPLATIQAQTSGTAFNVGSVLPTNAKLLSAEVDVVTPVSGGSLSAVAMTLEGGSDAAGSIIASTSVFTGASAVIATPGSNPYANRSGQQLKMKLSATSDTLANATAGSLVVNIVYSVLA